MLNSIWFQTYYGNTIGRWSLMFLLVILSFVFGRILYWISNKVFKKLALKSKTQLDDIIIDKIEEPVILVGVLLWNWYSFKILNISPNFYIYIKNIFFALIVINIAWLISRTVNALIEAYLTPLVEKSETDLDDILLPHIKRFFTIAVWLLAIIIGLNNAGYRFGAILAGFGIGGLAIAMAAKGTISNIIGGFVILMSKPFKTGDRIKLQDHEVAIVKEIGLRSTRIEDFNLKTIHIVPNSNFSNNFIENKSSWPGQLFYEEIKLSLQNNAKQIEEAINLIKKIISKHQGISISDRDRVIFKRFDDFAYIIQYVYNVTEFNNQHRVRNEINLAIKQTLEESNIEIANLPFELLRKRKESD